MAERQNGGKAEREMAEVAQEAKGAKEAKEEEPLRRCARN